MENDSSSIAWLPVTDALAVTTPKYVYVWWIWDGDWADLPLLPANTQSMMVENNGQTKSVISLDHAVISLS